jgi:electron-transferring-flavoprotein dehydrogenase
VDGGLIIGDSASLLNAQRLKGIHTAIKSGMLAAETILEALKTGDTSARTLRRYQEKLDQSSIKRELWKVRNFHQAFRGGLWRGIARAALQYITGGRGLVDPMRAEPGYKAYAKRDGDGTLADQATRFKGDGQLTFDRLTDVFHSGTRHDEDQPCHLRVSVPDLCASRCVEEYGNPCQYFCPAAVYEMVRDGDGPRLKINAANCVHCKTCDIADPYQIIDWTVPEGGGGPSYDGM